MLKDLYIRSPKDPNYIFGVFETSDPIDNIIAKIKMLLGTSQGQILGDLNCGIGIEDLIFETRINKLELEERISNQISQYISESSQYSIRPVVSFGRADGYDYAIIDIYIENQKIIGVIIQ